MKRAILIKLVVLLSLVVPLVGAVSCSAGGADTLRELALEWLSAHAVDVAKYTFTGRSGDDEVDAVLGARAVMDNMNAAEQLMQEGRQNHDLDKMEQAVEKRGGDYTYRVSYGTELLRQGRAEDAVSQFDAADAAVEQYGNAYSEDYAIRGIDELGQLQAEFDKNGFASSDQCQAYYQQLSYYYGLRYAQTNQAFFQEQMQRFDDLAAGCK
jgi:hypothetical protein